MGIRPAPQLANLTCYWVERAWVLNKQPRCGYVCRFIDDIFSAGYEIPSEQEYGMKYKVTSSSDSDVVYLGVHVYRQGGVLRTEVYDREDDYPFHIMRYPHAGTVASPQQKAGVITGRLVTCFQVCNTVSDFKASALRVIQRAFQRGYAKRLVQSVWARFLFQYWRSGDVRRPALKGWFPYAWKVATSDGKMGGSQRLPNHHQRTDPDFVRLFGAPHNAGHSSFAVAATSEIHGVATPVGMETSENGDSMRPLIEAILAFDADRGRAPFGQSVSDTAVLPLAQRGFALCPPHTTE